MSAKNRYNIIVEQMEGTFLKNVLDLYKENKWKDIIKLNEKSDIDHALQLLWVWPSEENLKFIKKVINDLNLDGIVSLGCGCGLLEWIITQSTDIPVIGYEINKEWWKSKYANPQFIKLKFCKTSIEENMLNSNYALLFCYFNNGPAFLEYVKNYKGNLVLIIGPAIGSGRHADPEPFKVDFKNVKWRLYGYQEIKNTKDFIAAYERCNS